MSRRRLSRGGLVAAAVLIALAMGAAAVTTVVAATDQAASTPAVHLGPQGRVPQFVVKCGFSHAATNDPIVHPAMAGMSHRHDFFGNRGTDADSTAASLLGGRTSCNQRRDTAAYWAPSLFDHGQPVTPLGAVAYYRPAPGIDPTTLVPYPTGLMMIAGDSTAESGQPVEVAAWACGSSSDLRDAPPVCPTSAPLRMRLTFPDCWNGRDLDSTDHRAHVARSLGGRCPSSHPVPVPQLTLTIRYPIEGGGHDLALASGPTWTAHADFFNAWDETELTNQVDSCLHRGLVCSVASDRAEDEPLPIPS